MPNLHVIQSNRLEVLADALAESLRSVSLEPFDQPVVVVPSTLMERWLTLALTDRLGFLANVRFELPAACAWRLMAAVLPEVSPQSPFDADALRWRLIALLEDGVVAAPPALRDSPLRRYLEGGSALGRYRLASELAGMFEDYATYRPDWLEAWAKGTAHPGGDAVWQSALWAALVRSIPGIPLRHPRHAFEAKLAQDLLSRAALPPSLSLFALPALPPMYLAIFDAVATCTPTALFLQNPSREYWTDAVRPAAVAADTREEGGGESGGQGGGQGGGEGGEKGGEEGGEKGRTGPNRLLAATGQHARALIETVIEAGYPGAELWQVPQPHTLLGELQQSILDLRERREDGTAYRWEAVDRSIELHSCHSPMREAEVLHDLLLARLQADRTLQPEDIVVYACGDAHAAAVAAVFAAAPADRRIPFSSYPELAGEERSLVRSVQRIIGTAWARGAAPEVLALVEEPAVARRFRLEVSDTARLAELARRAGIRWGWDDWSWEERGLPAERQFSWAAGLDRLVLGAALSDESSQLVGGVAPIHAAEGGEMRLLGALHELAAALAALARVLRGTRSVSAWMDLISSLIDEFHDDSRILPEHAQSLRATLAAVADGAARAGYNRGVPFEVAFAQLESELARRRLRRGAVAGGVRVIALAAGQVIPARLACVVGANDGLLPTPLRETSFDLMLRHPRRGDLNRRDGQRYAFLGALLDARDAFIVLYDGRSVRDNTPLLAAACVTELRDAIARATGLAAADVERRLCTQHPLQPFSPACFAADAAHASFAAEWFRSGPAAPAVPFLQGLTLPPEEAARSITIAQLERFFRHPAKFFFQRRMGLVLNELDDEPAGEEPFDLDALDGYWLRDDLVRSLLGGESVQAIAERTSAAGVLPPGAWGRATFTACAERAQAIAARVRVQGSVPAEAVRIDLELGPFRLLDAARWPREGPLVLWRAGAVRAQDRLRGWIQHLLRCAAGPAPGNETLFIGTDSVRFSTLESGRARVCLRGLLDCYWEGQASVLPFYPETSFAFADAERTAAGSGRSAAGKVWAPSRFEAASGGEAPRRFEQEDPYIALAARGRELVLDRSFERVARAIYDPLLDCVSPA
jgi:exodeoxyribonuclease V gamma subunit